MHELIGRFFVAERLVIEFGDPDALGGQLTRPIYEDLARFAVEMQTDVAKAGSLLKILGSQSLYALALQGDSGRVPQEAARISALSLLDNVTRSLALTTYTVHSPYELEVANGYDLAPEEASLIAAVGALLPTGLLLAEAIQLVDASDRACVRASEQARVSRLPSPESVVVAAVLEGFGGKRSKLAVATLLEACRLGRLGWMPFPSEPFEIVDPPTLAQLLEGATAANFGRLILLCYLLHNSPPDEAAHLVPTALRLSWESNAYHLRLAGLQMAEHFVLATEGTPIRGKIEELLEEFSTENVMLSTQLVETLFAYGLIEPPNDSSHVAEQISTILAGPPTTELRQLAAIIVSNQFEDVIAQPYQEAISVLTDEERTRLYIEAAQYDSGAGFWNGWLLKQLLNSGDLICLPAFERWTTTLDPTNPFIQEIAECYALAMRGCALHRAEPPRLAETPTADYQAWETWGEIIFWMAKSNLSPARVSRECDAAWKRLHNDLLRAAFDPLYMLSLPGVGTLTDDDATLKQLIKHFPDEIRRLAEWAAEHEEELTTLLPHRFSDGRRRGFAFRLLGLVGDSDSVRPLTRYVDDPAFGGAAVSAMKQLLARLDKGRA